MGSIDRLREFTFRYRGMIGLFCFIFILIFARPTPYSVVAGFIFVVIGQLLRVWAAGVICHYRTYKAEALRLVKEGPYSFTRNPLYLGNFLIGLGGAIISNRIFVLVGYIVLFYIVYLKLIVPYEEAFLLKMFGDSYKLYKDKVPVFFPGIMDLVAALKSINSVDFNWTVILKAEMQTIIQNGIAVLLLISRLWW